MAVVVAAVVSLTVFPVRGDETDNFYLPADVEFADLGALLESLHTAAVTKGVAEMNSKVDRALKIKNPVARERILAQVQSPQALAAAVAHQFGDPLTETTRVDAMLRRIESRGLFPGQRVGHEDRSMNFSAHAFYDPRAVLNLLQGSTIKVFGVHFGTDKLLHFHQVGHRYYARYTAQLDAGADAEDARREMLRYFGERGLFAEARGFGSATTGIYSNGDMAANYSGWKFYLNLSGPVTLRGVQREPLALRCGIYWRVNDHVRHGSGWFAPFISDHWNEALNPNLYESGMRKRIRRILEERAAQIMKYYTARDGRPATAEYFEELMVELSTCDGEDYGHSGQLEKLLHIGNVCIPALEQENGRRNGK